MSKIKFLPLLAAVLTITSCDTPTESQDYYDNSWTPGANAIEVLQPTVKNPQASLSALNKMRLSQNRLGLSSLGQSNILVVPVEFKGDKELRELYKKSGYDIHFDTFDVNDLNKAYFGTAKENDFPSVKDYYLESSYGKCQLNGVTTEVITLPESFITYLLKASNIGIIEVYNEIVDYIYTYIFETTKSLYIGDFDSNDDKKVDALSIVLNYPYTFGFDETSANASLNSVIPYFLGLSNTYFEDSYVGSAYSPKVNSYSVISDQFRQVNGPRTLVNNVGLMLGLDNYSDLTGNALTGYQRSCLGYTDMMEGAIGDHNPFSKYQLGWTTPRIYKSNDLLNDLEVELNTLSSENSSIVLCTEDNKGFGEYLIVDLYTPTGINKTNITEQGIYGSTLFTEAGIRVYKVDSRLARGINGNFINFYGETDFDDEITLSNGSVSKYTYDYAFTNSGINDYVASGITNNFPLVSLLSKNGINRHLVHFSFELTDDDLWHANDTFGEIEGVPGFYHGFRFNGDNGYNGDYLNIAFEVKSIEGSKATLTLKGVK